MNVFVGLGTVRNLKVSHVVLASAARWTGTIVIDSYGIVYIFFLTNYEYTNFFFCLLNICFLT